MLEPINDENFNIFDQLVQDYEDEFSSITGKKKNQDGKYFVDTNWHAPNIGYYWREGSKVVGFCIIDFINGYSDIAEFYVIPAYRQKKVGRNMAFSVFNKHRDLWQVRQILGAELAKKFWRRVIKEYTKGDYTELQIDDPTWGQVVCQRFNNQI